MNSVASNQVQSWVQLEATNVWFPKYPKVSMTEVEKSGLEEVES